MLEDNFYKRQSTAERHDIMDLIINLDILQGCKHNCFGCYVNKPNEDSTPDLCIDNAYKVGKHYVDKGLRFREIVLSPTDLFSATNAKEILLNEKFQKLASLRGNNGSYLGIASTAVFDGITIEKIKEIFDIFDSPSYHENMVIEFLIPMNVEKVLSRDKKYISDHKMAFDFLKNETPKNVTYSFANNVHNSKWLRQAGTYELCMNIIKDEFDCIIEHNPSIFRSSKQSSVKNVIESWKEIINNTLNESSINDIHITSAEEHHNSLNSLAISFSRGKAYMIPFIYENVIMEHSELEIMDFLNFSNIDNKFTSMISEAFAHAPSTKDCGDCFMLPTCSGRHVQNVMKIIGEDRCVFPDKLRTLYVPKG